MKILVLGGNGFLGTSVINLLVSNGFYVRSFDKGVENLSSAHEYISGDFTNHGCYDTILDGISTVIHLVSTTVPGSADADPFFDISTNLLPLPGLLRAAKARGVNKFIFSSSGGTVYGKPEYLPIDELHPTKPISSYGIVKLAIERYIITANNNAFRPIVLRISNPYGPRQLNNSSQGLIGVLMKRVFDDKVIDVWGDGSITRDYIHVDDLARAFLRSIAYNGNCNVFNISSGLGVSINEIISIVATQLGRTPRVNYQMARPFDVNENYLSNSLAHNELGWSPLIDLETGIAQMLKHLA